MPHDLPTLSEPDIELLARGWLSVDPDERYRHAVKALLKDPEAIAEVFGRRLSFGTAGLRGPLGFGPGAMNRVLVRVVAAAIADHVRAHPQPHVVIGFDARHRSAMFASDTARVLAARGVRVSLFSEIVPTPLLVFAAAELGAHAGVMVTASHNPRTDNGYKVYERDGFPLRPPTDALLAKRISDMPLLSDAEVAAVDHRLIGGVSADVRAQYIDRTVGLLGAGTPRTTRIAYTPVHGVGRAVFEDVLAAAGFPAPAVVTSQADPDPDFSTAPFPNPEEPGVLDAVIALGESVGADLAIAHDPDADRLAVAVPTASGWRALTGNEVGCLLAHRLLSLAETPQTALVVNTVVSSRLLTSIAAEHKAKHLRTLTGFKWIMAAKADHPSHSFVLGYEEALGYSIGDVVNDKDGISAGLVMAAWAAETAAVGRSLLDELDDLHRRFGVYVSGQVSLRFDDEGIAAATAAMDRVRQSPPVSVGAEPVLEVVDLLDPAGELAATDAMQLELERGWVMVRPSGTEPKLKIYGEVWCEPNSSALAVDRQQATDRLAALLASASDIVQG